MVVVGGLVVSGGAFGVLALLMDVREALLTLPPELAHCIPKILHNYPF